MLARGNGGSSAPPGIAVSPVAVFKRLRASEEWLRWLAQQMRGQQRLAMPTQGRPVRVVDGTSVSEPGSTGTDWRVHYVINLANLQCDFFAITSVQSGETCGAFRCTPGTSCWAIASTALRSESRM